MADLYQSVIEKTALSPQARYALGGAAIGGTLGAVGGYYAPDEKSERLNPNIRRNSAIINGLLAGTLGAAFGHEVGHDVHQTEQRRARWAAYDAEQAPHRAKQQAAHDAWEHLHNNFSGTGSSHWDNPAYHAAYNAVHGEGAYHRDYDWVGAHKKWEENFHASWADQKAKAARGENPFAGTDQEHWTKEQWNQKVHEADEAYRRATGAHSRAKENFRNQYGSSEGGGYTPPPRSYSEAPPTARSHASAYDQDHHGKGIGRMWNTIINSKELEDPAKAKAASEFMRTVGRPGADPNTLRQHMANFPQDTLTGQMMGVLFNKFHGDKTASLQAHQKLAFWDVYASYGVW